MIRFFFLLLFTGMLMNTSRAQNGDAESKTLTRDGAWCWFSDPRAVYHEGKYQRTYFGWMDSRGNVNVGYYDHKWKTFSSRTLHQELEVDDHDNPSLLITPDGRLLVFYSRHSTSDPIYFLEARKPESLADWAPRKELALNDTSAYPGLLNSYTYTNPVLLSEQDNRIYLFWRGMDFKPNVSYSDDMGKNWSPGKIMILPERKYENRRPYLKVASNGRDRIHLAFTDGHPRNEPTNSIYYASFSDSTFYRADGSPITTYEALPFEPGEADLVYNAAATGEKAWIWDVAADANGHPVLVYARFPDDRQHVYYYARWDGKSWQNHRLLNSGGWFPHTPDGETEREMNYSGGIVLDHEDPRTVYLSRKMDDTFEIEKWTTADGGKSWTKQRLTSGSERDNVRPFAVRNATADKGLEVLWMRISSYLHYTDYQGEIKGF